MKKLTAIGTIIALSGLAIMFSATYLVPIRESGAIILEGLP